jgi:hypothetical protein
VKREIGLVELAKMVVSVLPKDPPAGLHVRFGFLDLPLSQQPVHVEPGDTHLGAKVERIGVRFGIRCVRRNQLGVVTPDHQVCNLFTHDVGDGFIHGAELGVRVIEDAEGTESEIVVSPFVGTG